MWQPCAHCRRKIVPKRDRIFHDGAGWRHAWDCPRAELAA